MLMIQTITFNGIPLRLVPHEPDNGYRFYVSDDGTLGLRVAPDGTETLVNATPTTCENSTNQTDAKRTQRYLHFAHPWKENEQILVSHAVYIAWVGPFDKPCIDHKNGVTTDNRWENLEPVTGAENSRRATILRGLRAVGINPAELPFDVLDQYLAPETQSNPAALMHFECTHHMEC